MRSDRSEKFYRIAEKFAGALRVIRSVIARIDIERKIVILGPGMKRDVRLLQGYYPGNASSLELEIKTPQLGKARAFHDMRNLSPKIRNLQARKRTASTINLCNIMRADWRSEFRAPSRHCICGSTKQKQSK